MQARGWSAGGLRSLLLITGFLISSSYVAAADVRLVYSGVQGSVNYSGIGLAGKYTFNQTAGPSLPTNSGKVETFCVSSASHLINDCWYETTDNISSLPSPNGPMGLLTARRISVLVNEVLNTTGVLSTYNDNNTPTDGWASVQGAIWKLINSSVSIPAGVIATDVNNLVSQATSILAGFSDDLTAYYNDRQGLGYTNYYIHGLNAFVFNSNGSKNYNSGQDQIYWDNNPNFIIQVPVPAGVVLAGMGMICLGGFNLYRRRKMVVAA